MATSKRKKLKKFWEEQRQKECEQVRPLAEKIAKAIIKNAEPAKKLTIEEQIDKLRSNFYFQLEREGVDVQCIRSRHVVSDN